MGFRETLIKRPKFALVVSSVVLVAAIVLITFQIHGSAAVVPHQAFFSIDDGATWFSEDIGKLAPFTHDGKEADRVYVYECAGKRFVGYLERLTPAGLKRAAFVESNALHQSPKLSGGTGFSEVKRPGDQKWVGADDYVRSSKVYEIKCPDGGSPQLVAP